MSTPSSADPIRGLDAFRPDLFAGKQVLIVGGTSGIGAAAAQAFHRLGARVMATGATSSEVEHAGVVMPGIAVEVLDVRDAWAVEALVGSLPRLDHLVNCAGIIRRGHELDPRVFAEVVDVNLNGAMRSCAAAREKLAAARGSIVNTASMLAFFGGALVPAYSASKGGVAQLTKSLAIAYADEGIRVNAVAPGWIATPMTQALRDDPVRNAAVTSRTAMKRWGEPAEVASGIVYLASPLASFVTGSLLVIDGGYLVS